MASTTMSTSGSGSGHVGSTSISLYEFLLEAELGHYYSGLKNDLKINNIAQLKYVTDDDLLHIAMSKPEIRRLKKYFHKYYPQTYLRKIKKMILPKAGNDDKRLAPSMSYTAQNDKSSVKVPSKHIIPTDSIVVNKELGAGEFGTVQQGVWTNEDGDRIQVAIKCLSKEHMQNNPMEFLKEAAIMHTIDHEHVVRLYGVVLDTNSLMLVTELAPLRSLLECLKEPALRPSFPVMSLCDFAIQICDGMHYLESKRLIHRDLAARNILVFSKNKVKISDFGLSRALGVGKDYYQTNFNVNLKLPIAWCAPECINYLRFTSSSDVWAYGVTLWEMFSYGFQPWAALTGQQILEAIDEPNYQRLEQPECCPKEYYSLMLKCWQHNPNTRPKFTELTTMLPECKPEQVQAVKDHMESSASNPKKDQLQYKVGDVITVLIKHPISDSSSNTWKGVLNNGKTGFFNPANTVAYLGTNIPSSNRPTFVRPTSKSSVYSSKRKIRPELISGPQDDLKHTGHVGLDGAFFGDVSFLGGRQHQLPKQIVNPYKPQDDKQQSLIRASSDVSDRAPLLTKSSSSADGKSGPASEWSDAVSDIEKDSVISMNITSSTCNTDNEDVGIKMNNLGRGSNGRPAPICLPSDHEYHEISDEENAATANVSNECHYHSQTDTDFEEFGSVESPRFESLDFGPSLMDEVFKALNTTKSETMQQIDSDFAEQQSNLDNNVHNEIQEVLKNRDAAVKKKQATVKPISASDQKTLDKAIAITTDIASRSMLDLDCRSDIDQHPDSPKTPSSPNKKKFSFKFSKSSSPKTERRNFSVEAESITNIEETLSEDAKQAYSSLVEKQNLSIRPSTIPIKKFNNPPEVISGPITPTEESNPLRMLRNGGPVMRPKVRGNKHNASSAVSTNSRNVRAGSPAERSCLGAPPPPPQSNNVSPDGSNKVASIIQSLNRTSSFQRTESQDSNDVNQDNPIPLPPRDRSKVLPTYTPRQRKHPLILNLTDVTHSDADGSVRSLSTSESSNVDRNSSLSDTSSNKSTECEQNAENETKDQQCSVVGAIRKTSLGSIKSVGSTGKVRPLTPPPKPPRTTSLDESFEKRIEAQIDSLDEIPDEDAPCPPMHKHTDHVSVEDLLDFALDKPNVKRTQGASCGIDSDEVRLMTKVLPGVTAEECFKVLNDVKWDVHKAIKVMKLNSMLTSDSISLDVCKRTLISCDWDVPTAASYLLSTNGTGVVEDTTQV